MLLAVTVTNIQFERFVKKKKKGTPSMLPCLSSLLSFYHSLLPSSLLSSHILTDEGALPVTYEIWSLSRSVERHSDWWQWWDFHTINDLGGKGNPCWEDQEKKGGTFWVMDDVFRMNMCKVWTKAKVCEMRIGKKFLMQNFGQVRDGIFGGLSHKVLNAQVNLY